MQVAWRWLGCYARQKGLHRVVRVIYGKRRGRCLQLERWLVSCAVYALALSASSGCQSLKSVTECNRVLASTNSALDRIATLPAEPPSAQSYQQIADAYDELHHALKQTTIDTSELDKAARRYAKHLQRIEGEARNYANALQRLERAIETQANAEQANAEQANAA